MDDAEKIDWQKVALTCDNCGHYPLRPEHAHFVCDNCHYKSKCCEGGIF